MIGFSSKSGTGNDRNFEMKVSLIQKKILTWTEFRFDVT